MPSVPAASSDAAVAYDSLASNPVSASDDRAPTRCTSGPTPTVVGVLAASILTATATVALAMLAYCQTRRTRKIERPWELLSWSVGRSATAYLLCPDHTSDTCRRRCLALDVAGAVGLAELAHTVPPAVVASPKARAAVTRPPRAPSSRA